MSISPTLNNGTNPFSWWDIFFEDMSSLEEGTKFGNETVSQITATHIVRLDKTTVEGDVTAGGTVDAQGTVIGGNINSSTAVSLRKNSSCVGNIGAGTIVSLQQSVAQRNISAGTDIKLIESVVLGNMTADYGFSAERCNQLSGRIKAASHVLLQDCHVTLEESTGTLVSAHYVTIINSEIEGNVSSTTPFMLNSTITGTLSCASNNLTLQTSTIDTIEVWPSEPTWDTPYMQGQQTLWLDGCNVRRVVFLEGNGKVVLRNNSPHPTSVEEGTVIETNE